jgi:hypothetical protein
MRLQFKQPAKRWLLLAALVLIGAVVASVLVLALTDSFSPHGVLSGTFDRCMVAARLDATRRLSAGALPACAEPGQGDVVPRVIAPDPGRKIPFARTGDGRVFVVVTDSMGKYSISLPAGHYIVKGFFAFLAPADVTVTAGRRTEADFLYYWPN